MGIRRYTLLLYVFSYQGFAVVNASYRLAPKHTFPAPLEDVGAMVEWVVDHAEEYGLDVFRICSLWGFCGERI